MSATDEGLRGDMIERMARLETKIDMVLERHSAVTEDHEVRLRVLESWRSKAAGVAIGAGAGGGGVVGAVITLLSKGAA